MKIDLTILNKYVEEGWVVKNDHPFLPLSIYNYSRITQYEGKWDEMTLKCRGLVLDNEGTVVAKSFDKFFNYEELVGSKFKPSQIPNESFEVFEKMDGSLGITFYYKGDWIMATRGSFTSEQAIRGTQMLKELSIVRNYPTTGLKENWTYLFEIIYKDNRIVCDYDFEGLVLLGAYDRETLKEIDFENLTKSVSLFNDVKVVRKYNSVTDYTKLKEMISSDAEGFVIRFESGMRMKIKGDEYVRLHKILTNFSSKDIWELLKDGGSLDEFLDRVPDEFDKWVKQQVSHLSYGHFRLSEQCGKMHDYFRFGKYSDVYPEPSKKEFAEHLKKVVDPKLHGIMFAIWDGKRNKVDELIWKLIKPKFSKPFWQKEEI